MNDYTTMPRGSIQYKEFAEQLRDYSGLLFEGRSGHKNVTPTDIDGLIDLQRENSFIIFELKHSGGMPIGQKLALERVCDAVASGGANAILMLAIHNTPSDETIIAKDAMVTEFYWRGKWFSFDRPITLHDAIARHIRYLRSKEKTA